MASDTKSLNPEHIVFDVFSGGDLGLVNNIRALSLPPMMLPIDSGVAHHNVCNYTSMIAVFSSHALGRDVLQVFDQMLTESIAPIELAYLYYIVHVHIRKRIMVDGGLPPYAQV
ncbi:hypothetical protein L2E82_15862 [Cichorium intybus]|uniref:Uncharacterized protein n=1 Tax=Cichorium intybus TaxID=13427 RepID=A0ACB9F3A4_CICIN|nr:hypothetical protein L2E82_15862 [Cichorium intybus]